jgi:hypothetical protein
LLSDRRERSWLASIGFIGSWAAIIVLAFAGCYFFARMVGGAIQPSQAQIMQPHTVETADPAIAAKLDAILAELKAMHHDQEQRASAESLTLDGIYSVIFRLAPPPYLELTKPPTSRPTK